MSNPKLPVPPEFDAASNEERIAFVQELWDRITQHPEQVPLPESHKRILDERLEEYKKNPNQGLPWSEVKARLLEKFQRN